MNRKPGDIKNRKTISGIFHTPNNPLKKAFSLSQAVTAMMIPKLPLEEIEVHQQNQDIKKSYLNLTQPLTFSTRSNSKKRLSSFGEMIAPKTTRHSKTNTVILNVLQPIHECKQLKESELENEQLRRQCQKLKNQYQLTLNNLTQSKMSFHNMNVAYESKCQQTQALKQIINSIQQYVFDQKSQTPPDTLKVQTKPDQKAGLLSIPHKRRVSINNGSIIVKNTQNELSKHVLLKLQQYAQMKLAKSIKGSINDINLL